MIDRQAPADERENLPVVTSILAGLRYTEAELFPLSGDPKMIVESPLLKEILEGVRQEGRQDSILDLLEVRFGQVPVDVAGASATSTTAHGCSNFSKRSKIVRTW